MFDCCISCIFVFFGTDLNSLTCFNTHVGSPGIGSWAVSNPALVGWCWSNWAPQARWRGSWPWCVAPSTAASGTGQGRQDGYGHGHGELVKQKWGTKILVKMHSTFGELDNHRPNVLCRIFPAHFTDGSPDTAHVAAAARQNPIAVRPVETTSVDRWGSA